MKENYVDKMLYFGFLSSFFLIITGPFFLYAFIDAITFLIFFIFAVFW